MIDARPPLDASLFPRGLEWRLPPETFRQMFTAFDLDVGSVAGATADGWFRHILADDASGNCLFGTIVPDRAVPGYLAADRLAARAGVETPLLFRPPIGLAGERALLLRPWVAGVHGPHAEIDFDRLGHALRTLHTSMGRGLPDHDRQTIERLDRIAALPVTGAAWDALYDPGQLMALAGDWTGLATAVLDAPAPCHGDLHAGNILFRADGAPVFLDFEEAPHSRMNAMADLARAFERLVLVQADTKGADWVYAQAAQFFGGYLAQRQPTTFAPIRETLAFHLAVVARICLAQGAPEDPQWTAELSKVVQLAELAERYAPLIAELDGRFFRA